MDQLLLTAPGADWTPDQEGCVLPLGGTSRTGVCLEVLNGGADQATLTTGMLNMLVLRT